MHTMSSALSKGHILGGGFKSGILCQIFSVAYIHIIKTFYPWIFFFQAPGAPRGRGKVGVSFNSFKKMFLKRGVKWT